MGIRVIALAFVLALPAQILAVRAAGWTHDWDCEGGRGWAGGCFVLAGGGGGRGRWGEGGGGGRLVDLPMVGAQAATDLQAVLGFDAAVTVLTNGTYFDDVLDPRLMTAFCLYGNSGAGIEDCLEDVDVVRVGVDGPFTQPTLPASHSAVTVEVVYAGQPQLGGVVAEAVEEAVAADEDYFVYALDFAITGTAFAAGDFGTTPGPFTPAPTSSKNNLWEDIPTAGWAAFAGALLVLALAVVGARYFVSTRYWYGDEDGDEDLGAGARDVVRTDSMVWAQAPASSPVPTWGPASEATEPPEDAQLASLLKPKVDLAGLAAAAGAEAPRSAAAGTETPMPGPAGRSAMQKFKTIESEGSTSGEPQAAASRAAAVLAGGSKSPFGGGASVLKAAALFKKGRSPRPTSAPPPPPPGVARR